MSKDPAFLFYSKDFYEGTRMMLPEERACYIDLMIYQHQNGYIPIDLKRVLLYCSGIDEATLRATLEAKFKLCDKGWYNDKLKSITEERKEYSTKQSENGTIGQFFKVAKSELKASEYKELREFVNNNLGKEELLKIIKEEATLKASLKRCLSTRVANANEDVIVIKDVNKGKGGSEEKGDVVLPWDTENFKAQWQLWKVYKSKEHRFKYKTIQSEQAALKEIANKSGGDEKTAIAIIHQSMANGWKGFFELKNRKNEQGNNNSSGGASDEFRRKTAERLGLV